MAFEIIIDLEKCTGCSSCYDVCAFDVYGEPENGKTVILEMDNCTGCRSCESQCPEQCITINEK